MYLYIVMDISTVSSTFSVLADATRLRLLAVLAEGPLSVTELASCLQMSQPRVSHHLAVLLRASLVRVRREGTRAFYSWESRGEPTKLASAAMSFLTDETTAQDRRRAAELVGARKAARREFFDAMAETWPANLASWIDLDAYRSTVREALPKADVLADVGCGTGWLLPVLATSARRVIGVDHAPQVLAAARQRAHEGGWANCEFRLGEAEHLPLRDREADVVFMGLVLQAVPDPQAALEEASRVCAPSGTLVVIDPLSHQVERARDELGALWQGFSGEEMVRWVRSAGFDEAVVDVVVPPRGLSLLVTRARLRRDVSSGGSHSNEGTPPDANNPDASRR